MSVESLRPKSTKSYRGKLSIAEIAEGVEATYRSAESAYEDAVTAHAAGKYRAAALAYLDVLQEIGRVHALRGMARIHPRDQKAWAESWRRMNRHDFRIAYALTDIRRSLGDLNDLREFLDESARIALFDAPLYEVLRKRLSYTDFDPDSRQWSASSRPSTEELNQLSTLADTALDRARDLRSLGLLTQIALQIEYEELSLMLFKFHKFMYQRDKSALARLPEDPEIIPAWTRCWDRFHKELGIRLNG